MEHGKIALITGANRGIGLATARGLAQAGATVVMACRGEASGTAAANSINRLVGRDACTVIVADLASQDSIRRAASQFCAQYDCLDVLINNAATMSHRRRLTEDGFELQFGVNHLAPFTLTLSLMDRLRTADSARIVNVSSDAHRRSKLDFDNLQLARGYTAMRAYGQSKLSNILFTRELARRLENTRITANALHPGVIATGLLANFFMLPKPFRSVLRLFAKSPEDGAETSIHLASSPDIAGMTGRYFRNSQPVKPSRAAEDDDAAARLWKVSEALTAQ